jgi:hypothetical protein
MAVAPWIVSDVLRKLSEQLDRVLTRHVRGIGSTTK